MKKFTNEFKTEVVLEVIKERETLAELSKKYQVNISQIQKWKKEFLSNASEVFEQNPIKVLYPKKNWMNYMKEKKPRNRNEFFKKNIEIEIAINK